MDYKTGFSRNQLHMFTESLDDAIPKDHPVRFIDAYINQLDLAKLKVKLPKLKTGRPPFHPGLLLKIYVYCYFEKIRTSRMIEKECKRNIELKWLSEGLAPDHKTIANFRKDNKLALKEIFKAFLNFCYDQNLFDLKLVALDGTKLRAQNSSNEVYKRETIDQTQKKIEERIKEYMEQLDENDKKEDLSLDTEKINKALEKLKKKQTILEKVKKRFEDDPELKRIFRVDPDSTFQSDKGQKAPGYNCQIVVDSKNKLIVTVDITNEQNDGRQLTPMLNKLLELKNDLAQEHLEEVSIMVCDAGYHNEQQILKSLETKSAEVLVTDRDEARKNNDAIGKRRNSKVVPGKGFKKRTLE